MNINSSEIKEMIRSLEYMLGFFRNFLEDERRYPPMPQDEREKLMEITDLRFMLKSSQWPVAVEPELICGEDEDSKLSRASGLINDFIRTDIADKNFLDFGCGEGHVPYIAANLLGAKNAVGFDIKNDKWDHFDQSNNLLLTTKLEEVEKIGKFDVILLNDVLDHAKNPKQVLDQIKSLKTNDAKVFVRVHPWTSRHATHLYRQINKAYIHLIFTDEELYAMGYNVDAVKTRKVLNPIEEYKNLFLDAGLSVIDQEITTKQVEMFFTLKDALLRRIKDALEVKNNEFPRDILEIQFIDYILV